MGQVEKNTVKAENQLSADKYIKFYDKGKELKVLFVGNSITRHGVKEDIGWFWDFGMAASAEDKDYVHIVMKEINKKYDTSFCVCQATLWEMNYQNPDNVMHFFEKAREFDADIIIMRVLENIKKDVFDQAVFEKEYKALIDFFNKNNRAKVIVTNGFWPHICDESVEKIADENNFDFVRLNDLGVLEEMRATGLFEHSGVAYHPGDKGMENIAKRILEKIL